jgi:protein arginine N-methyltransferase 1
MYDTGPLEAFEFHQSMLTDVVRTDSFLSALVQTIKPGDVVLDIGSGTGVLACFACMAGAKHVYAIERGPVIGLAREICARNNLQKQITFINEWSTNIELPEAADVLVTETIGNIGFEEGILRWVSDAKKRLLKKGARIIPSTLEMFAVPIESAEDYDLVDEWTYYYYTFDFSPLHTLASSNLLWIDLQPEMFLSEPASLAQAELAQIDGEDINGGSSFVVKRKGIVHGFGGWFTAELAEGIDLSNVPPSRTPSWSHTFLPLESPLQVETGDRLELTISTSHHAARWQWQVTHYPLPAAGQAESAGSVLPEQTTQAGELSAFVTTGDLSRVPKRNTNGDIDLFILQRINGRLTISEIVRQTQKQFPDKFDSHARIVERIHRLITLYAMSNG